MEKTLQEKFDILEKRYQQLQEIILNNDILADPLRLSQYAKEFDSIKDKRELFLKLIDLEKQMNELELIFNEKHEPEFITLAKEEYENLKKIYRETEEKICLILKQESQKDSAKDIIMEIRAGTGGLEASLFVNDLYRMYTKYANYKNWKVEFISAHPTSLGGFKEVIFGISGRDAWQRLKFESGVHRVQRIPETEAGGRVHTSTATVAVLPEPTDVEVTIEAKDLRIDVFRSSGPGGQSVNTTDSAVRITHLPTGIIVTCQDERSQLKNKNKAMRVLRARLLELKKDQQQEELSQTRKSQIGRAQRSEKIRTYNFPDRRVTDHRAGITIHRLEEIMEGNLDLLIDELLKKEENE